MTWNRPVRASSVATTSSSTCTAPGVTPCAAWRVQTATFCGAAGRGSAASSASASRAAVIGAPALARPLLLPLVPDGLGARVAVLLHLLGERAGLLHPLERLDERLRVEGGEGEVN